jgi:hypothetical protein
MWDMFKAELLRFRGWAIALALLNFLFVGFIARITDMAQQPLMIYRIFGAVYGLAGLLLGFYQIGSYRRPNAWLTLLHRPLSPGRIAIALFGAGVVLLTLVVAVPLLAIAGWQAGMTARVVDSRHLWLVVGTLSVAWCAYLAGAYGMLANRRYSASAAVFLALLLADNAAGIGALALHALILTWLAVMVAAAFKPDLIAPPRSMVGMIATALPLQMGIYLVLTFALAMGTEIALLVLGVSPNNSEVPPQGGVVEAQRARGKDLILANLAGSHLADVPLWREQVALSDVFEVVPQLDTLPARGQIANVAATQFDDERRGVRWVFSHDRMRFRGYSMANDHSAKGDMGQEGAAFGVVPIPAGGMPSLAPGDAILLGRDTLYRYDSLAGEGLPWFRLPAGEVLAGAPQPVGENIAVLSDKALYIFDLARVIDRDDRALLAPRLRVPSPGAAGTLSRVGAVELVDGYLVSFTFARGQTDAPVERSQDLFRVHDDGRIETISRRRLTPDFAEWFRQLDWWLSPAMHGLRDAAVGLFAPVQPLQVTTPEPPSRQLRVLAAVLALLCLFGAAWRTRRLTLSLPARWVWILVSGAIGIPALVSLWLVLPPPERLDDLPSRYPAMA